jgi:hypothetical protein
LDGHECVEGVARQKRTKMWPKWGISWGLIDVWQSEWSVVGWIWIAIPSTKFWTSNWACRKFVPSWSQKFSPTNRRNERRFGQKSYFSGSAATILAWSESVWILPFPKTPTPPQRSSFWNCGQYPKGRDGPAEGTSTWRFPTLLPGVGATSPVVCSFSRQLLWRG